MNKVPENATVKQVETHSQPSEMRWLAGVRAFLQIPNPAIVKVFVVSSLATFITGIALALEWICHGKSHTGFRWIIYYALVIMCLPLLILIGLRILMYNYASTRGSNQIADSSVSKEPSVVVQKQITETTQRTEETETEINNCRSLAVVVASDDKKMPRIKRAVSFPSHGKVRSCRTR